MNLEQSVSVVHLFCKSIWNVSSAWSPNVVKLNQWSCFIAAPPWWFPQNVYSPRTYYPLSHRHGGENCVSLELKDEFSWCDHPIIKHFPHFLFVIKSISGVSGLLSPTQLHVCSRGPDNDVSIACPQSHKHTDHSIPLSECWDLGGGCFNF